MFNDGKGISRRRFVGMGVTAALGLSGMAGADAFYFEPHAIRTTRHNIHIDGLPSAFDGFRIVQVSDLHHSKIVSLNYIQKVIKLVNTEHPDIVVLTGDYVTGDADHIEPALRLFESVKPKYGIVGVLGNHDHWVDAGLTRKLFAEIGIEDLTNKNAIISLGGGSLCVAGVGDYWEDEQNLESAFEGVENSIPRILLSHNPDYAEAMPAGHRVDIMLSGHTHGGQFFIPFYGAPIVPSDYGNKYRAGLVNGTRCPVYISRGIGMIRPPVRFCCPPELPVFTLRSRA